MNMKRIVVLVGVVLALLLCAPASNAATILVGQCVEYGPCWYGPDVPWSDTLTGTDLADLGLGTNVPLVAAQTACCVIRLGVTTIVFDTTTGPVTESLPEFSGGGHNDPCNFCEVDTVGTFAIPANALDATISGIFGNSLSSSTAGVNVYLGPFSVTPEPGTIVMLGTGVLGLAGMLRRKINL